LKKQISLSLDKLLATRNSHICRAAIPYRLCSGEEVMFVVDWRSEQDYANFEKAETADIAWEWLRRDNEYEQEFRRLTAAARQSEAPDQFRKKWGLSFRS
jgi:Family of unknown function (DUF6499)